MPHVQHAERSAHAHARWQVDVVYIKDKRQAGAAMRSLSICKLAAVKMPISHIASKAGGLRGILPLQRTPHRATNKPNAHSFL